MTDTATTDTSTTRLACVQLEIDGGTVEANLTRALEAIDEAAADGADLIALPELFDVGYFAFETYERAAVSLASERLERFADRARQHGVAILAGTVIEDLAASAADGLDVPAESGLANTAVLFDATGTRRLVYRKHHLFGYGSAESERLEPGERVDVADVAGFTVGVTTCYDLRFPELYRRLLDAGADLVLVPSAWPYPRVEHWQTLPRSRAIENLSYVAAINGSGTFESGDTLVGRTTVYDPWGTPIATCDDAPETVTADLDPDRVAAVREEFPALGDRRIE
ncbi:Predicted amidohydrolase [Halopenitus malekzadehii]|uniref:Predicted amidohydrolase n=1 Tax=Halopenitus malekzadehii TaxID=1267564 RepID=A0A1H6I6S0_9EURY|nr:carbon-nitrogen family hydrolase [Halopenitus malekzadehii]SEH42388.1 Predicted amidohydrolase [Halopenitus malekzadehii]